MNGGDTELRNPVSPKPEGVLVGVGPPPHSHDLEEMFHVLDGEIEVTIRGETPRAGIGKTVNIPALAPHIARRLIE
ncbi:MAG: cupin domain-containing protein [Solirubrobacteraceae bacterium]